MKIPNHECVLFRSERINGWACNEKNCKLGLNEFYKSDYISCWRCDDCDYDICVEDLLAIVLKDKEMIQKKKLEEI